MSEGLNERTSRLGCRHLRYTSVIVKAFDLPSVHFEVYLCLHTLSKKQAIGKGHYVPQPSASNRTTHIDMRHSEGARGFGVTEISY